MNDTWIGSCFDEVAQDLSPTASFSCRSEKEVKRNVLCFVHAMTLVRN